MQSTYEIMVVSYWGRKSKQMAERMVKFSTILKTLLNLQSRHLNVKIYNYAPNEVVEAALKTR